MTASATLLGIEKYHGKYFPTLRTASERMWARSWSIRTTVDRSSGALYFESNARPTSLCKAANLNIANLSNRRTRSTPELHSTHTPSKRRTRSPRRYPLSRKYLSVDVSTSAFDCLSPLDDDGDDDDFVEGVVMPIRRGTVGRGGTTETREWLRLPLASAANCLTLCLNELLIKGAAKDEIIAIFCFWTKNRILAKTLLAADCGLTGHAL